MIEQVMEVCGCSREAAERAQQDRLAARLRERPHAVGSGILGDVSTSLLTLAGAPAALVRRPTNILAITACLLLPLSLLKELPAELSAVGALQSLKHLQLNFV